MSGCISSMFTVMIMRLHAWNFRYVNECLLTIYKGKKSCVLYNRTLILNSIYEFYYIEHNSSIEHRLYTSLLK